MSNLNLLLQERFRLLKEMASLSCLVHGSWLERFSTCTRPRCRCHTGRKHGPRYYLVVNENGRQRQKYLPGACVDEARKGLAQDKRLREIVRRITEINLVVMKEGGGGSGT